MQFAPANAPPGNGTRAHSIRQLCDWLGVSKGLILQEIRLGKLHAKRVGRRRFVVLDEDLQRYLTRADA